MMWSYGQSRDWTWLWAWLLLIVITLLVGLAVRITRAGVHDGNRPPDPGGRGAVRRGQGTPNP
ncbi:hypothetical protein NFC73_06660 [Pseudarthrobacter sp. RMG13]|uniref:Uncharacterized protein n=1 Tax=Pseudarthrobacter humi TaxID=2952523 RepID=A0ABT1LLT2_9MICC|nr:hypothetical protein [Pseudarthrobacter humi]MCP8999418.1 hypothetical protein [Pseudarthrobacter humi]